MHLSIAITFSRRWLFDRKDDALNPLWRVFMVLNERYGSGELVDREYDTVTLYGNIDKLEFAARFEKDFLSIYPSAPAQVYSILAYEEGELVLDVVGPHFKNGDEETFDLDDLDGLNVKQSDLYGSFELFQEWRNAKKHAENITWMADDADELDLKKLQFEQVDRFSVHKENPVIQDYLKRLAERIEAEKKGADEDGEEIDFEEENPPVDGSNDDEELLEEEDGLVSQTDASKLFEKIWKEEFLDGLDSDDDEEADEEVQDEDDALDGENEENGPLKSLASDIEAILQKHVENYGKKEEMPMEKQKENRANTIAKIIEDAKQIVGGKKLLGLLEEIATVGVRLVDEGLQDVLKSQAYLFAINDGTGLEEYLDILCRLFTALDLYDIKSDVMKYSVTTIEYKKEGTTPSVPGTWGYNGPELQCIDISQWLNNLNTETFVEWLNGVAQNMEKYPVVFKIPFVEKEIINNTKAHLNDVVFIKEAAFPPYTSLELRTLAEGVLAGKNYTVDEGAWKYYDRRINEEKSDGRFYGIQTIEKIVHELIYKKTLFECSNGILESARFITEEDSRRVCQSVEEDYLTGEEMLSGLIGCQEVKDRIHEICAQIELSRKNSSIATPCIHMKFVGNPGTGKTTVARIIGKILNERGILRVGNFFEYAGRDFVGRYIGETAPKTSAICRAAYGSVLFIDEAYSLFRSDDNGRDFGREAIDTLIAEMENHRSDLLVIMAGYSDEMELLMKGNSGLESRIPYTLEFKNFDRETLYTIYEELVKKHFKYEESLLAVAKDYFDNLPDSVLEDKTFSNGRFVRNLFERTWAKAAVRYQFEEDGDVVLSEGDFNMAIGDSEFELSKKKKTKNIGFGVQ